MATTYELIAKNVLGSAASDVTFTSIPGTYDDLIVVCSVRTTRANALDYMNLDLNGDTSNKSERYLRGSGSAASSASQSSFSLVINGDSSTADCFSQWTAYIPNYAGSTNKSFSCEVAMEQNSSTAYIHAAASLWSSTAAITSIKLYPETGPNWKADSSFYLFGITKS